MTKYYITTPLYYVNSKPHIGHSYTQVICDSVARFFKQAKDAEVFFMTGTDEHGEKIEKAALDAGFAVGEEKKFVDTIVPHFKKAWHELGIEYDHFIRTTDLIHEETVKKVLATLYKKGEIEKKVYKGFFCTPCEAFWPATQVTDGLCPDCKRPVEKLDEENYFFKISKYQQALLKYIKDNPSFIYPDIRRNEVLSFLEKNELQDLCISRPKTRMNWGIEIPFDSKFVTYVWFDALINYIAGIGYSNDRKRFETLWPNARHFIGKDILRHHAIYWPIMLMALGELPPKMIFVHGWWVMGGEKMSKSKGNVVDPMEMVAKYGVEAFRYYLLSAVQFGYDGTFSEKLFIEKYNSDLANDLGNLVNRTLTMVEKYYGGVVPSAGGGADDSLKESARSLPARACTAYAGADSFSALKMIWGVVGEANKYIEEKAPWKLAKENKDMLAAVMYNLIQALGIIAVTLYPFMPETSKSICSQLGQKKDITAVKFADAARKDDLWGIIPSGSTIKKSPPLFPRIEIEKVKI